MDRCVNSARDCPKKCWNRVGFIGKKVTRFDGEIDYHGSSETE